MKKTYYIGTNVDDKKAQIALVVYENGVYKIIERATRDTSKSKKPSDILDSVIDATHEVKTSIGLQLTDIAYLGMAIPGSVDINTGTVQNTHNIKGFGKKTIKAGEYLTKGLGLPVSIVNSTNATALGEQIAGAGKGQKNVLLINLGKEVEGGIILNGNIHTGINSAAGELHFPTTPTNDEHCTCGIKNCFTTSVNSAAFSRLLKPLMLSDPASKLWQSYSEDILERKPSLRSMTEFDKSFFHTNPTLAVLLKNISPKMVSRALEMPGSNTDRVINSALEDYAKRVATGIASLNILQFDTIILGGGISRIGEPLLVRVEQAFDTLDFARNQPNRTQIKLATLGTDAAIIGAAASGKKAYTKR